MSPLKVTPEQVTLNNAFMNELIRSKRLKNDAALSRLLKVAPPVISKIRSGLLAVGATLMLNIHETFDMSIADIRAFVPK